MDAAIEEAIRNNEAVRFAAELHIFRLTGKEPQPGPFAREWLIVPEADENFTPAHQRALDLIGQTHGCHGCGSVENLTPSGHSVANFFVPKTIGTPTIILPHCVGCNGRQGHLLQNYLKDRQGRREPNSGSPSHLQFYVSDSKIPPAKWFGDDPQIISDGRIITVPCRYWLDGDTEIVIGPIEDVAKDGTLAFEGPISTPSKVLVVSNVEHDLLIEHAVSTETAQLSIWTDGQTYPGRVAIGIR